MPDNLLEGKVALITGGAHRIGATIARMLHAQGMQLVIHYHTSEKAAHALQNELHKTRPESVMLVRGDLNNGERLAKNLVFETVESFDRLDVVINNASRFYPTPVGKITETQWDDIMGPNLKAPYFLVQAAAPHLKKTEGSVINIADIYGERPLMGYLILGLWSVEALLGAGRDPLTWSVGASLRVVRAAMRQGGRLGRGSLACFLRKAVKDRYVRMGSKSARNWPRKKKDHPPGLPKMREATEKEKCRAQKTYERIRTT